MHTQDYYAILGISKNASNDDIRKAYRTAARKFHPDINKDAGAEDRFKEIGEAYEVLKDSKKRKLYDQYGKKWKEAETAGAEHGFSGFSDFNAKNGKYDNGSHQYYSGQGRFSQSENLDDILSQLFGQAGSFSGAGEHTGWAQSSEGMQDAPMEYELQVSLEDVYHGRVKHISLPIFERGTLGQVEQANKEIKVTIPKGVTDGSVIRLGSAGANNEKLHIRLKILPHSRYSVNEYDLKTVVAVSPWEAMLGAKIPVETLSGDVKVTVPKGAQNGKQLRVKAKGLTKKDGTAGDLIVILEIRLPTSLSDSEETLLKTLATESQFDPRKDQEQKPVKVM
ncbi:DnaJ C-terminal domain-containing protein [Desulforhopalus sp. 52FAK]